MFDQKAVSNARILCLNLVYMLQTKKFSKMLPFTVEKGLLIAAQQTILGDPTNQTLVHHSSVMQFLC
jgi:hypothetical protein